MNNIFSILLMLLTISAAAQTTQPIKGQLLLSFKNEVIHSEPNGRDKTWNIPALDDIDQAYGCQRVHVLKRSANDYGGIYKLYFDTTTNIEQLINTYQATGLFKIVAPDYYATLSGVPNDTLFHKQWNLLNDGSVSSVAKAGADMDMLRAWEVEDGDPSVVLAIVDAGLRMDHADFEGRLWRNSNDIPGNGIDDDNNGYVDDSTGWNFVANTADATDDQGHGTFVAGIAAANVNNITGIAGVDQHCRIMNCKAADNQGLLQYSWMIEGIAYAADNRADIINFSAGGFVDHPILHDVVKYAYDNGVLIVAATGNFGSSNKMYPAAYDEVLAVGATGNTDTVTGFSNYGPHIDVVAPGEDIYSLSHQGDTVKIGSGTSFAAPHVSGLATLLLAQNKARTPDQLKQLIQNNAEDKVGSSRDLLGWDQYYGYGRVNAWRALTNQALGIAEKVQQHGLEVFPVPATDVLYIKGSGLAGSNITIANIHGTVVYSAELQNNIHSIHIAAYVPGTYFVTVRKDELKESRKIIIQ